MWKQRLYMALAEFVPREVVSYCWVRMYAEAGQKSENSDLTALEMHNLWNTETYAQKRGESWPKLLTKGIKWAVFWFCCWFYWSCTRK